MFSRRVIAVLGLCLAAGALPGTMAEAAAPVPGESGHDVSYPQCGAALPSTGSFGIVGVNNGRAFSANPCLATQLSWASALPSSPALYTNPANPAPSSSYYWPASGSSDPALCINNTVTTDPGCAYDYGWHAAANALSTASAASPAATTMPWWLDVETGNTYNGDGRSNAADLQGMIDYLRSHGVPSVGFYSTASQWNTITGGWTVGNDPDYRASWAPEFTPSYPLSASPVWVAGLSSATDAQSRCATSFTGGTTTLAQYTDGSFDGDLVCGAAPPPAATAPTAPLNAAAATASTGKGITLSWAAPTSNGGAELTGYAIARSTKPGQEVAFATVSCTASSCPTAFRDSQTRAGRRYYYAVRATNRVGTGAASNETSAIAR